MAGTCEECSFSFCASCELLTADFLNNELINYTLVNLSLQYFYILDTASSLIVKI